MNTRTRWIGATLLCVLLIPAWAGIGDIDPEFGDGGRLANPVGYGGPIAGPGGTIRYYSFEGGVVRILQFGPEGKPDLSFGDQGVMASPMGLGGGYIRAMRVQPDGSAYFAIGGVQPATPAQDGADRLGYLVRFDPAGRHDVSFGDGGRIEFPPRPDSGARMVVIESMAPASDGSLYVTVGHYRYYYDCATELFVHRLDATGRNRDEFGDAGSIRYPLRDCHEMPAKLIALDGARMLIEASDRQIVDARGVLHTSIPDVQAWEDRWGWPSFFDGGDHLYSMNSIRVGGQVVLVVARWHRDLTRDYAFGRFNPGWEEFALPPQFAEARSFGPAEIDRLVGPASPFVYLALTGYDDNGGTRSLVARMSRQGMLDLSFGSSGYAVTRSAVRILAPPSDGSVLLQGANSSTIRLLDEDRHSPGRVGVSSACGTISGLREADGSFSIWVSRELGSAGSAEVRYRTQDGTALAGSDYSQTQGVLSWDVGETGSSEIRIPIAQDSGSELEERFDLLLEVAAGGARLECPSITISIAADTVVVSPPAASGSSGSGGGGALDAGLLLPLLAGLLAQRRRRGVLLSSACLPPPH